jgi:hypothetical protein
MTKSIIFLIVTKAPPMEALRAMELEHNYPFTGLTTRERRNSPA